MVEVHPDLFVGDGAAYAAVSDDPNWAIVQAAKDPWHRAALGYTGRSAPADHPEYLWAYRDHGDRLILNMVDVNDPSYFAPLMVNEALAFIWDRLDSGMRVLVHCNQGESRAPSLALLYLHVMDPEYQELTPAVAMLKFMEIYPKFNPKPGIWGYVQNHWTALVMA